MPKRTDSNHAEIRQAFRDRGFSWLDTFELGHGFPDGVIGKGGLTCLIEVKDGAKPPSRRQLTYEEHTLHAEFQGWIEIVYSVADVEAIERRFNAYEELIA